MLRAFFKDSAIYGIGGILARAVSLLLLPFYTRVLSPTDYGVVDLLVTFGALVNLTVALEISQGLARYVPEAASGSERAEWASTGLWFTLVALIAFGAIASALAPGLAALLLGSDELAMVFRLGLVAIVLNGIFYLGQSQLRFTRKASEYSIATLTFTVASIGATVLFVLAFELGVVGVVLGQVFGFFIGAVLVLYFARDDFRLAFSREKCRRMLEFSLPLVPSSIAVFVAGYIDRIAIRTLMDVSDVGIYSVGYRLASPVVLLTVGFQTALTPLVVTHYKEPETPAALARIFRYFLVIAMLACVGASVFAREVVAVFATPSYAGAAPLVALLAPAMLLPTMYVFAPGLFIAKKTRSQALVIGFGALFNTILNFVLIPFLGTAGAALATLLSALTAFAVFMVLSQREYRVPHEWRTVALASAGCVATIAVAAAVPFSGIHDVRGIAAHVLLAAVTAVWLPLLLLGADELRLIGRKTKSAVATVIARA